MTTAAMVASLTPPLADTSLMASGYSARLTFPQILGDRLVAVGEHDAADALPADVEDVAAGVARPVARARLERRFQVDPAHVEAGDELAEMRRAQVLDGVRRDEDIGLAAFRPKPVVKNDLVVARLCGGDRLRHIDKVEVEPDCNVPAGEHLRG